VSGIIKNIILVGALFLSAFCFGQEKKATRYFEKGYFSRAGRLYEEVLQSDSSNRLAINNLAHCYRNEKRYEDAQKMFKKTLAFSEPVSPNRYHYAETFFLLGDYSASSQLLYDYLLAVPEDKDASRLLVNCEIVSNYEDDLRFELVKLRSINSPYADFSPVVFKNGIVFTTERKQETSEAEFAIEDKPFLSIYYSPFSNARKTSFWEAKLFSSKLNTPYHDGPVCFNEAQNRVYFTRVEKESGSALLNQMKIFVAEVEGDKWVNPKPFELNNNDYGIGHPAVSKEEDYLIFSSNMPGGEGGMDLYITKKKDGNWEVPKNLGSTVNTSGDEVFPTLYNGFLYFSSNGHPGFGGLDLFVVHLDSLHKTPENLRKPINSAWDDLSLTFLSENKAFYSSDRPGGMGKDDIYGLERSASENEYRTLSGILEYRQKPAPNTSIALLDEDGIELQRTTTNELGGFDFEYLKSATTYQFDLGMTNKEQLKDFDVYLVNSKNQKVKQVMPNELGDFVFELLKPDDHDNLPLLEVEDRSLLAIDIKGQVYESEPGDFMERVEIVLYDKEGNVISRTYTDIDGQFIFSNIFPDDQYIFRLANDNPNLTIVILDLYGNVIQTIVRTGNDFVYTRLSPDDETISLINEHDVTMKVKLNQNVVIPNIYYEFDKWELNETAKAQLRKLVLILEKNPRINVQVESHTDSRATEAYNLTLSSKRANSVVDFIKTNGIEGSRISGVGLGEKHLVNKCIDDVDCTEEEHAENRRTEFRILRP
jgi:outer membrane protein OmpA-like peptidoglycan-associated protein